MSRFATSKLFVFVVAACALTTVSPATAQVIFPPPGLSAQQRNDGGQVVGISLNSYGVTISSLGFYDHGGDGIATSYQLGLWDGSQNLLATATVTPSSPLHTDSFRYAAISPVTIGTFANPQPFTIGVLLPSNLQDVWLDNAALNLGPGLTGAGTGQYTVSGSLVYPTTLDDSPYYVVNANGPAPPLVPEPGSLVLIVLGTALSMLRGRTR
jgi:hypothetical protein